MTQAEPIISFPSLLSCFFFFFFNKRSLAFEAVVLGTYEIEAVALSATWRKCGRKENGTKAQSKAEL